jgi:hypothetical protein
MTTAHVLNEKLFSFDTGGDVYLVATDPTNGPVVAVMERPNGASVPATDEARAIAGEIERRWNIHVPLARALHELRTFIGKPGSNAVEAEIAFADAVLARLLAEPGGERMLDASRERFEAYFRTRPDSRFVQELILERSADGKYKSKREQDMWESWLATDAALPTPLEQRLTELILRFFAEYPDIEENEHLSGADMIQFVTMWMRDAHTMLEQAGTV